MTLKFRGNNTDRFINRHQKRKRDRLNTLRHKAKVALSQNNYSAYVSICKQIEKLG
jgi:hypothetical protein